MNIEIENKAKNEILVLLDENHGERKWFWFPKLDSENLEGWWRKLQTIKPYYKNPQSLPGEVIQVSIDMVELLAKLDLEEIHYSAHLHSDDDSVLQSPNGERIMHDGFSNQKQY